MLFEFEALPPETNSDNMYTGAGPNKLFAAAEGWQYMSTAMCSTYASLTRLVKVLQEHWQGPSEIRMAEAVVPYQKWLETFTLQIRRTSEQVFRLLKAYENAHEKMIHPDEIAWNRYYAAVLRYDDMAGEYAEEIAKLDAEYEGFWAEDAAQMWIYAQEVLDALSKLTPWPQPPEIISGAKVS